MKTFLSKYLILGIILISVSCEESINLSKESFQEEILVIKSDNEFNSVVNEILEFGKVESISFPGKFESFQERMDSFLAELDQAKEDDFLKLLEDNADLYRLELQGDEKELIPIINDGVLAQLFNKDGLLIINDRIFKISEIGLESAKTPDESISSSDLGSAISNLDDYQKSKIVITSTLFIDEGANGREETRVETCEKRYSKSNKDYRLRGEIFYNNIGPLFSNVGSRTKHQKKSLGIWFNSSAPWVRLNVNGEVWQELGGVVVTIPVVWSGIKYDDGKMEKVFEFCVNANCQFGVTYMDNTHITEGVNGSQYTCYTSY